MRKRGAKMQIIERMLHHTEGCTAAELKEALGWPSVSIPQRAAQLGLKKLYVLKTGGQTRYWADPPPIKEKIL